MKNVFIWITLLSFGILLSACDSKPKKVNTGPSNDHPALPPQMEEMHAQQQAKDVHEVVAEETLDTKSYTYVRVKENEESFWIAVSKTDIEIGKTYYFSQAMYNENFYSKEHDRTFDKLYLVSNLSDKPMDTQPAPAAEMDETGSVAPAEGAVAISDLLANPGNYAGKLVRVSGKSIKVNPMIMNRNWVHLNDGSGKGVDLTITTQENVEVGQNLTFEGTIAVDKDFGAGYRYDVIMENASLVK